MNTIQHICVSRFLLYFLTAGLFSDQLAAQVAQSINDPPLQQSQTGENRKNSSFSSELLVGTEDIADQMLTGIDAFLLHQIDKAKERRSAIWQELTAVVVQPKSDESLHNSSKDEEGEDEELSVGELRPEIEDRLPEKMDSWIALRRGELENCIGLRDQRLPLAEIEILQTNRHNGIVGSGKLFESIDHETSEYGAKELGWQARSVRWQVLNGVFAEGLLIEPVGTVAKANIVAIPDADQTPEHIVGLIEGLPESQQTARILASAGCRVLIPLLVSRSVSTRGPPDDPGRAELTNREFVYRPAFELGRHILGYEVQKVLAAVDWLAQVPNNAGHIPPAHPSNPIQLGSNASKIDEKLPLGIVGYGEGGSIALLCGALDSRVDWTFVKGAFGPREGMWSEPICRNLFSFLNYFGDAELAAMIWPRTLVVDFEPGPKVTIRTRSGAPGDLTPYSNAQSTSEFQRAAKIVGVNLHPTAEEAASPQNSLTPAAAVLCGPLKHGQAYWLYPQRETQQVTDNVDKYDSPEWNCVPTALRSLLHLPSLPPVQLMGSLPDAAGQRQDRQVAQLIQHTQLALDESSRHRQRMIQSLDTTSLEKFQESTTSHRQQFYREVIGQFSEPLLPLRARTRQKWQTEKWTGHEVVLDVWPGVIASGVLLLPKDLAADEKRPVVVCQHGLEGRPTDVFLGDHPAYHDFAAKLCERGYIVFAPQNPYLMQDRFRTLQRKANSIGKTLFSIIIPQHQQLLNWLKTLPNVDSKRIAFYGLSYGGKSAMRIPAVLQDYCLSICSADFNEWIVKNASTQDGFSYVWTGEYEIFEYNLGNTFGYAEMASLICPRPFMVERGHFDAVAIDQWVGYEYAKVLNLYQARLGIGNRTEIEWFAGPHTINGKGTFEFLDRHLLHTPH